MSAQSLRSTRVSLSAIGLGLVASAMCAVEAPVFSPYLSDHSVLQRDQPLVMVGTAEPGAEVIVTCADHRAQVQADDAGSWRVTLPAMAAGGPYEVVAASGEARTVLQDVMIGDVWLCAGQSNMGVSLNRIAGGDNYATKLDGAPIRLFRVKYRVADEPRLDFHNAQSGWSVCDTANASSFSAIALAFASRVQQDQHIPIGLIHSGKAGSFVDGWIPATAMDGQSRYEPITARWNWLDDNRERLQATWKVAHDEWAKAHGQRFALWRKMPLGGPFQPHEPAAPPAKDSPLRPSVLWNGMMSPLTTWPIRGVVWYQGESNSDRAWQYRWLIKDLIGAWRTAWKQAELPVVLAQLPEFETDTCPYDYQDWGSWEIMRESQALAGELPQVGVAMGLGYGDVADIHPRNKWPFGERLGQVALAVAYGQDIPWKGPRYERLEVQGKRGILHFTIEGSALSTVNGGPIVGFEVAGEDQHFVPALAEFVDAGTIAVWSDAVAEPSAIRYAWDDTPAFNVIDASGLLLGPFRTDQWTVPTQGEEIPFYRTWPIE